MLLSQIQERTEVSILNDATVNYASKFYPVWGELLTATTIFLHPPQLWEAVAAVLQGKEMSEAAPNEAVVVKFAIPNMLVVLKYSKALLPSC